MTRDDMISWIDSVCQLARYADMRPNHDAIIAAVEAGDIAPDDNGGRITDPTEQLLMGALVSGDARFWHGRQFWFQQRTQFQMLGSHQWIDCGDGTGFHDSPFSQLTDIDARRAYDMYVRDWFAAERRKRGLTVCTFRIITTATEKTRHPEWGVMVAVGDETIIDQIVIDMPASA